MKKNGKGLFKHDTNTRFEDSIKKTKVEFDYSKSKPAYASQIVENITTKDDLNVLDLNEKIELLVGKIKQWNHIK